ncbi:DNA-binding protein YbiB [Thauera sp. CAU 1555]|uniref:DNA-binding protein YbiB n=1 Tax=Thauera sedimentorum TaxID=2767595 RepID=A0ABR9BCY5_9RHOO|nr:DNA-binding protein YbiB [Thauera sedimentorum]MBC9073285.1 DNA-binding protein YbiB [Thauera sedimentorum]MBD8504204.1 DNA-binding protein YbiB [Thauera sedimentorum]
MSYAPIIKEIGRGAKGARPLDAAQAQDVFGDMLDGKVPDLELGAIVMALRIKSESTEELLGFKRAMDARTPQVAVPAGPRCVVLPTYNGARRQANLMPLLALLLAREGVPVLIHGRHDFESRTSPFELLAALGIHPAADAQAAGAELRAGRVACLKLDTLLPGLDRLLALRLRMGVRGSAHTMAKLVDPCRGHSVRVVAVTHPEYLERMHGFLSADGGRAMLLRGTEGEAFANPRRRPEMKVFDDGAARIAWAGEEGGAPPLADLPDCPEVEANAALIRAMLDGRTPIPQPVREQVEALVALARA